MKKESKKTVALTVFQLIERIVVEVSDYEIGLDADASVHAKALALRLGITPVEALLVAAIVENSDDEYVSLSTLSRFFRVRNTQILALSPQFEHLRSLGLIKANNSKRHNHTRYFMTQSAIKALRENRLPEPTNMKAADIAQLLELTEWLVDELSGDSLSWNEYISLFHEMIQLNRHIEVINHLVETGYSVLEQRTLLFFGYMYFRQNETTICEFDLNKSDAFLSFEIRTILKSLEDESSSLIANKLIELASHNGLVDSGTWQLTEKARVELFEDVDYSIGKKKTFSRAISTPENFPEKKMFYNPDVEQQVNRLAQLLQPDNLQQVMDRLKSSNFRSGFSCLFYGGPGTGKTETVYQLCRQTGRPIMMVNIASIRNKYVGETEHNIKRIFNNYRQVVKESEVMPVLLFNEADALFTRRNNGTQGVDKMENAMQNIILEEMERLDGILIATTNLATNLDPAFERRFIYKIEFTKPTAEQSRHIWQSLIPSLTDEQSMKLAKDFPFSGGQIENIARKTIIDEALSLAPEANSDNSFLHIMELCRNESLHTAKPRVGF